MAKKKREGLALTTADSVNRLKWRDLQVHLKNIFQARPMLTYAIDGNIFLMHIFIVNKCYLYDFCAK